MHEDLRLFLRHKDIEQRAAHGDDSRWRIDPIRIGASTNLLNLDSRLTAQQVEDRAWRQRQVCDLDSRIFTDDSLRAIRQSQDKPPAPMSLNHISGEQLIVDSIRYLYQHCLPLRATLDLHRPIAAEDSRRDQSLRLSID